MRKGKRGISAALILALLATMATGCGKDTGKQEENDEDPIVVQMETYYNGAAKIALDKLVTEFNNTVGNEKGIYVKASSMGDMTELFESLGKELKKPEEERNLPDIFCCYGTDAIEFDQQGLLADMDDYFTEKELDEYIDAYVEQGRIGKDDSLILFPVAKSVEVMTINKTDWDKFAQETGASLEDLSTWEGVTDTSKAYYEWTGGKAMFGRDAFANYMLVGAYQLGEDMFPVEDGKVSLNLNKETLRKLWDNYYVPYIYGYYTSNGRYRSDDMKTGDLIAAIASSKSKKQPHLPHGKAFSDHVIYKQRRMAAGRQRVWMAVSKSPGISASPVQMKIIGYDSNVSLPAVHVSFGELQVLLGRSGCFLLDDTIRRDSLRDQIVFHRLGFRNVFSCALSPGYNRPGPRMCL